MNLSSVTPQTSASVAATDAIPTELQAQLEVLRLAYAERLDEKIAAICDGWASYLACEEDVRSIADAIASDSSVPRPIVSIVSAEVEKVTDKPAGSEILVTVHRAAHTLAGSGATFGFSAVSQAARRAEILLKKLVAGEACLDHALRSEIAVILSDLRLSSHVSADETPFSGPSEPMNSPGGARAIYLFCEGESDAPGWSESIGAFGYAVEFFHDLERLDAALQTAIPAAIVVDCQTEPMECGQGGRLLSTVLRDAERRAETPLPVVWLCARSDLRARLQGVRLGGSAFFPHPVDVDSLLVKLDDLTAHSAPEPFRILIVDDEPSLGRLFSVILRQAGMETLVVSDPMHVMAPLVDFRPDLILMDVYMPGCSGVELAAVIRQQEAYIGIPIMFLSVETDITRQLDAMRQGGDDFLIKPVQPRHLVSAVTTRAARARVLRNLMVRDSLTGLLNHTKIKEQLEIELDRARRVGTTVSLAMLDIDHFKVINDTYGHATGDRVLRSLSRLLGQRLRQTDVIGRYGGEEFAVILTGSGAEDARHKLEIVRAAFASLSHFSDGREFRVTFSAGIAAAPPFGGAVKLSEAADRALYEAKRAGRNCTLIAERTNF